MFFQMRFLCLKYCKVCCFNYCSFVKKFEEVVISFLVFLSFYRYCNRCECFVIIQMWEWSDYYFFCFFVFYYRYWYFKVFVKGFLFVFDGVFNVMFSGDFIVEFFILCFVLCDGFVFLFVVVIGYSYFELVCYLDSVFGSGIEGQVIDYLCFILN